MEIVFVALVLLGLGGTTSTSGTQTEQTRETWQRVSDLFTAMGVRAGAIVADVGAGDGFLTVRLSSAVGERGKVYAVDTDEKMTDGLHRRLADARITNVDVVIGASDDPHLPADTLDSVIILNAYHEMPEGPVVLRHILHALKPGGRLVLCEPVPSTQGQSRAAQMQNHVLGPEIVLQDLRTAGFEVVDSQDAFATNFGGTHFGLVVAKRR
jgi:ubiquinone/menaquinone biosynthesis C-methylase UbiE